MHPILSIGTLGSMELLVIAVLLGIVGFPIALTVYFVAKTRNERKAARQPPPLPRQEPDVG